MSAGSAGLERPRGLSIASGKTILAAHFNEIAIRKAPTVSVYKRFQTVLTVFISI
jgi:hypothetical protein